MRIFTVIGALACTLLLASCGSRVNNPEEMAVPIINAVKAENPAGLMKYLPSDKVMKDIYTENPEQLGYTYYNKYSTDYKAKYLEGKMHNAIDIIKGISKIEGLDWSDVQYSNPARKDVNDSGKSYTMVTTTLKFGKGNYDLTYNAVRANSKWYLLDDVDFRKHAAN